MINKILRTNLVIGVRSYVYPIYVLIGLAYGLMLMAFPERYFPTVVPVFILFEPGSWVSCSWGLKYLQKRRTVQSGLCP